MSSVRRTMALEMVRSLKTHCVFQKIDRRVRSIPLRRAVKALVILPTYLVLFPLCFYAVCIRGRMWFPHFQIVLTTRCSLRCEYCANLMQYYEKPYDVPPDTLRAALDRLMSLCDYVDECTPIGGEPFLCRNLADVLEWMLSCRKIGHIMIYTNGTVPIRDERLLELLKNRRVCLSVSDYGRGDVAGFCRTLKENGIAYDKVEEKEWLDFGGMEPRGRSREELRRQFKACHTVCRSVLNGTLHYCPRSGHGIDLGLIPAGPDEYLELLHPDRPVTREQLAAYYFREEPVLACDYCDAGVSTTIIEAGGSQLSRPLSVPMAGRNQGG